MAPTGKPAMSGLSADELFPCAGGPRGSSGVQRGAADLRVGVEHGQGALDQLALMAPGSTGGCNTDPSRRTKGPTGA